METGMKLLVSVAVGVALMRKHGLLEMFVASAAVFVMLDILWR